MENWVNRCGRTACESLKIMSSQNHDFEFMILNVSLKIMSSTRVSTREITEIFAGLKFVSSDHV
jgi:hypothetical protein